MRRPKVCDHCGQPYVSAECRRGLDESESRASGRLVENHGAPLHDLSTRRPGDARPDAGRSARRAGAASTQAQATTRRRVRSRGPAGAGEDPRPARCPKPKRFGYTVGMFLKGGHAVMPDAPYAFDPKHEAGFCRWCGRKVRARRDTSVYFCTVGCAIQYANLTIDKGIRWVARATPRPPDEPIITSNGAPHPGPSGESYA